MSAAERVDEEVERYRSLVSPGFVRGKLSLFDLS
jgi:hypothetical protein